MKKILQVSLWVVSLLPLGAQAITYNFSEGIANYCERTYGLSAAHKAAKVLYFSSTWAAIFFILLGIIWVVLTLIAKRKQKNLNASVYPQGSEANTIKPFRRWRKTLAIILIALFCLGIFSYAVGYVLDADYRNQMEACSNGY